MEGKSSGKNGKFFTRAAKTVSWRLLGTLITATILFMFTGSWSFSISFSLVEMVIKVMVFYFHELLWDRIYDRHN